MLGKYTTKILSGVLTAYGLAGAVAYAADAGKGVKDSTGTAKGLEACVKNCNKGSSVPKSSEAAKPKLVAIPFYCPPGKEYSGKLTSYTVGKKDNKGLYSIADKFYAKNKKQIWKTPGFKSKNQWKHDFACYVREINNLNKKGDIRRGQHLKVPSSNLMSEYKKPSRKAKPTMSLKEKLAIIDRKRSQEGLILSLGSENILGRSFTNIGVGWHNKNGRSYMVSGTVGSGNGSSKNVAYEFASTTPHPITNLHKERETSVDVNTKVDGSINFTTGWDLGRYLHGVLGAGIQLLSGQFSGHETNRTMDDTVILDQESKPISGHDSEIRPTFNGGGELNLGWLNPHWTNLSLRGIIKLSLPTSLEAGSYEHQIPSEISGNMGVAYKFGNDGNKVSKRSRRRARGKKKR